MRATSRSNSSPYIVQTIYLRSAGLRLYIPVPDLSKECGFVIGKEVVVIVVPHPFGTLGEGLGTNGDIEAESSALLEGGKFLTVELDEDVLECLPHTSWP